jgi:hypothetical protein
MSSKRTQAVGWVIAPEASAEFVDHMEPVLDVYRRPLRRGPPGGVH